MTLSNLPPLVTVFGGSGFVGRHVVRALAKRGYRIRVAVRRPDLAFFLQPLGNVGQISFVQANLRYRASVDQAVQGADHVVNCVGILFESGRNSFDAVQDFGARAVAEAARSAGARLTHVSAIGADAKSGSDYAASKGRAEAAVLSDQAGRRHPAPRRSSSDRKTASSTSSPPWPGSCRSCRWSAAARRSSSRCMSRDVAEAVARSVDGKLVPGKIYELGGRDVMTFRQCLETMLSVVDRKRAFLSLPFGIASLIGSLSSMIPFVKPALTSDQVKLLKSDNIVSRRRQD